MTAVPLLLILCFHKQSQLGVVAYSGHQGDVHQSRDSSPQALTKSAQVPGEGKLDRIRRTTVSCWPPFTTSVKPASCQGRTCFGSDFGTRSAEPVPGVAGSSFVLVVDDGDADVFRNLAGVGAPRRAE